MWSVIEIFHTNSYNKKMIYGYVTKTFLTGGYKLSLYTQPINLNYLSNQAGKYDAYELFLS